MSSARAVFMPTLLNQSRGLFSARLGDGVLIATCVAVLALVGWRYLSTPEHRAQEGFVASGQEFWDTAIRPTQELLVIVFAHSECRFCSESMPFYRELVDRQNVNKTYSVSFVTIEPEEVFRGYMRGFGLATVNLEHRERFDRIRGTPALVIIDRARLVRGSWTGKLNQDQQQHVREMLGLVRQG
jgi:hypothetical protein